MQQSAQRQIWETYTSAWANIDPDSRRQRFEQCLNPACSYADPRIEVQGYQALAGYMEAFQQSVPGGRFLTLEFQQHHGRSLAHWEMQDSGGQTLLRGSSFARYDEDGRLQQMSGFFAPMSAE